LRLHVVSDVHGSVDALARAGDGADALICLGDLIHFLDYADHGQGIFGELFGPEAAATYISLRDSGDFPAARAYSHRLWSGLGEDPWTVIERQVRKQYAALFAAMPTPAYLTYGNVDVPRLWTEHLRDGMHLLDGQTAQIGGLRFGFVGGGLQTPMRTPYEVSDEEYAAKIEAVGAVDVLCAHIPPAVPELTYDVVARRFERGSAATLAAIRTTRPRLMLFGHVHQPLSARMRIGRTECVNVGHFRGSGRPYVLDVPDVPDG
jgi:Icc-related predicted phosphoesterase